MRSLVLTFFMMISVAAPAAPLVCADTFADDLAPRIQVPVRAEALSLFDLAVRSKAPDKVTWALFENVTRLKNALKAYRQHLDTLSAPEFEAERRDLLRELNRPDRALALELLAQPVKPPYTPAQFGLRRDLVRKTIEAFRELPENFRPPVGRVHLDPRLKTLNDQAREFMKEQTARFDALLPLTGYKTYGEFVDALRASEDPAVKAALEILDADKVQVVMRRPENGRFWIPKTGFHNQYVSGSSRGYNGREGRYAAEGTLTHRTKEEYFPLDDDLKPKYGTLQVAPGNGVTNLLRGSAQYGPDLYVFKTADIRDRLSVFPGDSLNHLNRASRSWSSGVVETPTGWDQMLIPWDRRLLIVPFMVPGLRAQQFGAPALSPEGVPLAGRAPSVHTYWESQIFGRADLDMVESFIFEGNPPAGEFLRELRRRGIKIYEKTDAGPEWKGDAP